MQKPLGQAQKNASGSVTPSIPLPKLSSSISKNEKRPLAPLTQLSSSGAVQPQVVEVNAIASRELDAHGDTLDQNPKKSEMSTRQNHSVVKDDRLNGSLDSRKLAVSQNGIPITHPPSFKKDLRQGLQSIQISQISDTTSADLPPTSDTLFNHDKKFSPRTTRVSESWNDVREAIDGPGLDNLTDGASVAHRLPDLLTGDEVAGIPQLKIPHSAKDEPSKLSSYQQQNRMPFPGHDQKSLPDSLDRPKYLQPRLITGLDTSRASSSNAAGAPILSVIKGDKLGAEDNGDEEPTKTSHRMPEKTGLLPQSLCDQRVTNVVLSQIRSRVLSKEYWMRDENARDCFCCGDPFSTFRRKHHCRTCGQIFDAKCTSLVPGEQFGQSGSLRVCKPCESIINGHDDSSEYSDDGSVLAVGLMPRHGSAKVNDVSPARSFVSSRNDSARVLEPPSKASGDSAPTMAIPATRRVADSSNRRSAILEFDSEPRLVRPSSSRSLKSPQGTRSFLSGHKRHNSRHLLQRGFRPLSEDRAPFHRNLEEDSKKSDRLPAFHGDSVIDPDLATFASDDESSGDEQVSIMAAFNGGDSISRSIDSDKPAFSGLSAFNKRSKPRAGDKSVSGSALVGRDPDNISMISGRTANPSLAMKRRNLSISGNVLLRSSPRTHRFSTALPALTSQLHESASTSAFDQLSSPHLSQRIIRSSAMRGVDAPALELNNASIQHVRKLLRQLLQDSDVSNVSGWEKALIPILLQATDDVNPDVQHGDDIDIRHYIKLKKVPGGRPGDTSYVSGLVFTKNLALKSMPRSISNPNILIITFSLEYARHQQHFMSLGPVIRQEREYLQNLVHRIAALHPHLLLVQRNVSGLALEFLEEAKIATAYNVKPSVLEAISRCSQTRIITSVDKLAIKPAQTGKCATFYLKTYVYDGRKKTYMYLTGCSKDLGCTIVLRGGDNETLVKIKTITEFMTYVVYNLKLETCLMRDEFALIPTYLGEGSMLLDKGTVRKSIVAGRSESLSATDIPVENNKNVRKPEDITLQGAAELLGVAVSTSERLTVPLLERDDSSDEIQLPEDIPMPTFYADMVEKHKTKILSASPFVKFMQPYLLMRAREQERRLVYLKRLCDQDTLEVQKEDEDSKPQTFVLIKPEMIHQPIQGASKKFREVLHAVHDAEYDKALHNYRTQKKQWEAYISGNINLFDPFAHQNITVLYSVVCTVTTVPCSGPDLLALAFYNEHEAAEDFEADCTLGQYIEDLCLGANTVCTANGCEKKMIEHHRQYVHGEAQLSVTIDHYPAKLRGFQDIILMWSTCRICGKDTQVMPMSDSTWKYSFGKYLELSFCSSELHARAGICPHDIHRDHLRYFGFKGIALRVQYDPITLHEIIVPRTRITWKVVNDLRFKNDVFSKAEERLNKFMMSVRNRIKSIKVDSVIPEKADDCKLEIDRLMKRAGEDHIILTRKLQDGYMSSKHYEIIPLNRSIRATQEKVVEWDNIFAEFDNNFFPSEKDIRRLATLQLKRIFLDRDDSVTSLSTNGEGSSTPPTSDGDLMEKTSPDDSTILLPLPRKASTEGAPDIVVEDDFRSETSINNHRSASPGPISPVETMGSEHVEPSDLERAEIRHLDLAVPPTFEETLPQPRSAVRRDSRPVSPTSTREVHSSNDPGALNASEYSLSGKADVKVASSSSAVHSSGIPRLSDIKLRRGIASGPPPLNRTQTPPVNARRGKGSLSGTGAPALIQSSASNDPAKRLGEPVKISDPDLTAKGNKTKPSEKRVSDRLALGTLKSPGINTHSMIPRSIAGRRKDSKVSTLAKHFEQLSREFEKERLRERRQRAAKSKQARVYPMAASKPTIEIYRNVHDAVDEQEQSDSDSIELEESIDYGKTPTNAMDMAHNMVNQTPEPAFLTEDPCTGDTTADDTCAEYTENDDNNNVDSHVGSDAEGEGSKNDGDRMYLDEIQRTQESQDLLSSSESQVAEIPKHQKTSLMKMLTNFWAERSASGWQALDYPLNATDHVFADSDIIIREDEPSSLISFALGSEDYQTKLQSIQEKTRDLQNRQDRSFVPDPLLDTNEQMRIERSLLQSTGTHLKYQFQEGSARMLCKIFYAEQFDAVRRKCGVQDRIVDSLSRCLKWDSKGGKTKSVFLKTLDDRLVLKSLSQIETQAFLRFAPAYFQLMAEALFHELPSVIAKMLGFYQIIIKNPITGVEFNWFLLVMENLFYDRNPTRIFDLKGSMRNRRIQSTGEQNEVLLDENMVEFIYESPLFAREHSKRLLRASVWNDTLFLARQNVMDYSLMIAIDENRKEIVVGIIDCIRTYTWDKKLESWMKDRGKNRPTVTSPKEYKNRFREAMGRYVLQAPK